MLQAPEARLYEDRSYLDLQGRQDQHQPLLHWQLLMLAAIWMPEHLWCLTSGVNPNIFFFGGGAIEAPRGYGPLPRKFV